MKSSFNIDNILGDMLEAAKGVIAGEWKKVKAIAETFLESKKKRLLMLAEYRIQKKITDEEFRSFLDDEKQMFGSELAALKLISKAMAQKAANAALDVLYEAIRALIPGKKTQ